MTQNNRNFKINEIQRVQKLQHQFPLPTLTCFWVTCFYILHYVNDSSGKMKDWVHIKFGNIKPIKTSTAKNIL